MELYTKLFEENKGAGGQPPIQIVMPKEKKEPEDFEKVKAKLKQDMEREALEKAKAKEEFEKRVEEAAQARFEEKEKLRLAESEKEEKEKLYKGIEKRKDIIEKFKKHNIKYKDIPLEQLQDFLKVMEFSLKNDNSGGKPEGNNVPPLNPKVGSIKNSVEEYYRKLKEKK